MVEAKIEIVLSNGARAGDTLKELTKDANRLNREIKDLKPGTEQFVAKSKDLQAVNGRIGDIKNQIKGTTQASDAMKKSFGGILNFIPGFSQLSGAFGQAQAGVGGLTSSLRAMIAIPVVAVLAAIVAVIAAITAAIKTDDETADAWGKKWDQISSIFDVVLRRLGLVGKALMEFASGNFDEAFNLVEQSVKGMGDELERAWILSGQLADRQNELDDAQNKFNATEQARKNIIDSLILQSKDRTKTEAARIQLELDAEEKLRKLTEERMALTQRQSDIDIEAIGLKHNIQRQLNETTQAYGLRLLENSAIGGEEAKKISDAIRKVDEAEAESLKTLEKLQNQRNALLEKAEQERQKREAKEAADRDKKAQEEKAAHEKLLAEKAQAEQEYANALKSLQDLQLAAMDEGREKDLASLQVHLERQLMALDMNAPFYAERMAATIEAARKQRDDINKKWDEAELEQQKRTAEESLAIEKKRQQDNNAAMVGSLQVVGNFFGAIASLQEEGSAQARKWQYAQAVASAIQGSINAYTSTAAIPIVGGVLAPIAAAAALALGLTAANKIKNQKVEKMNAGKRPKLEKGGYLDGPSHAQGGIDIEAEGGEFMFSKKAVANIGANRLRLLHDRFKYANGGPVTVQGLAQTAATSSAATGGSQAFPEFQVLVNEFQILSAKIDAWPRMLKVQNVATETEGVLKTINTIKDDADI